MLISSVSALILLPIGIVPQLYAQFNPMNPVTSINSFCKSRMYLNQTSAMLCRWLLILACIDRCLSCSTSPRIRSFATVRIARRIILLTIVIWILFPIHTIIYSNITPPGNVACSITNENVGVYHRFYTIIMGGVLPTIISLICSLFIWKYFHKRTTQIVARSILNQIDKKKKVRDQQVLIMLLIQVLIFLISTIPFMSVNIYDTLTKSVTNKSNDRRAIEAFAKTSTELLIYLITLSFYSNTIVSKTFRKEFLLSIRKLFHPHRIYPSSYVNTQTKTNTMQMNTTTINKLNQITIVPK